MKNTAYEIAEDACKKQLEAIHGTVEEGMTVHGTLTFAKWAEAVESALESVCREMEKD
jgi:hypothetical protein